MGWLQTKVIWYKNTDLETGTEITDWTNISVRKGLDNNANTVEITLKNPIYSFDGARILHKYNNLSDEQYSLSITRDDVIEIYAVYEPNQTTIVQNEDNLLTTMDVTEVNFSRSSKLSQLKIIGIDKTYDLLNKLWTQAYTVSDDKSAPEIIVEIIRNACESNEAGIKFGYENEGDGVTGTAYYDGTGLFEIDARLESDGGLIQDTRPDTTAYPATYMGKLFKPVHEWITELSQVEHTNTGAEIAAGTNPCKVRHRFYLDRKNRAHWFYPSLSPDYSIEVGVNTSDQVFSTKLSKSIFDVVNTVMFNAGRGLLNEPILGYFFDKTTKESRLKIKYVPMMQIGNDLRNSEVQEGNISINEDDTVNILVSSGTTSWGEAYSSDNDYADKFWEEVNRRAQTQARAITSFRGTPRYKGTLEVKGKNYQPGELISFTDTPVGVYQQKIRMVTLTHNLDRNSWRTTLDVEEDEGET